MAKRRGTSREEIAQAIRAGIVEGKYGPGSRLPTREEMGKLFDASLTTIQHAMAELEADGFVEVRHRKAGTEVSEHPPHLNHYRFVLCASREHNIEKSPFVQAVRAEAQILAGENPGVSCSFSDLAGTRQPEVMEQILGQVERQGVAGLIFVFHPFPFIGTPILSRQPIPRVAIAGSSPKNRVPEVWVRMDQWYEFAMNHLRTVGHRRVAYLGTGFSDLDAQRATFLAAVERFGMTTHEHWIQSPDWLKPNSVRNCVHLLMHPGQLERPDAIVITDDALVEAAGEGLLAAGLRSDPDDPEVAVIAHANFPHPTYTRYPMYRIGVDVRQLVRTCKESIDRQRQGESVPDETLFSLRTQEQPCEPRALSPKPA